MTAAHRQDSGFTLIEIAIVLFISGILLSGIITLVTGLSEKARISATNAKQQAIKTALSTFLTRQSRLPCPANPTLKSGDPLNGFETITTDPTDPTKTCIGAILPTNPPKLVATGTIPWASLGLPEEASIDAYANRFTYQVVLTATNLNSLTVSGMKGIITIHSAGLGVPKAAPTGNQTNDCTVTANNNPCAAVVVIVSHGADGLGAYTRGGVQVPFDAAITGKDELENANSDSMFVIKDYSGIPTNPYDDTVLALTPGDFLTSLAAQGTLKDYQATLNATFSAIKYNVIAAAYANGRMTGSWPNYYRRYDFSSSYSMNNVASAYRYDPWGNLIVYATTPLNSTPRIDCNSTPSTSSVFTLTSRGPDGIFNGPPPAGDDIVNTTYVSDIVAIISNAGCNM